MFKKTFLEISLLTQQLMMYSVEKESLQATNYSTAFKSYLTFSTSHTTKSTKSKKYRKLSTFRSDQLRPDLF